MTKTKTKKIYNKNTGGKVIASGGFGCVFTPALKCQNAKKRELNKVTKLMKDKYAIKEYEEINYIKNKLNKIKNYTDYFLIYDATLCRPAKLTKNDLKNYPSKCSALPKNDITKNNINTKIGEIMSLNIPNGGIPIDDFVYNNGSYNKLYKLQDNLISLLEKGIIPMNNKNIYHSDIKDSNILVDVKKNTMKTRLIDWGLTTEYIPFKNNTFPNVWRDRPFQFNVPFSVILFSDEFITQYTTFIESGKDYSNYNSLKPFVIDYINFWNKKRGPGHYKFINEIFYILYSNHLQSVKEEDKPDMIETEFTFPTIVDYIVKILLKFTKFKDTTQIRGKQVNLREYLDNVYIQNLDIWGFINCYYPFIEMLSNNHNSLNSKEIELFESLKSLFVDFLYKTSDDVIQLPKLFKELKNIKQLIYKINIEKNQNKITQKNKGDGIEINTKNTKNTKKIFKYKGKMNRFKNPIFIQ